MKFDISNSYTREKVKFLCKKKEKIFLLPCITLEENFIISITHIFKINFMFFPGQTRSNVVAYDRPTSAMVLHLVE